MEIGVHVGTNRPATPADQGRQDSEAPVSGHQEVLIKPLDSLIAVASGNGTPKHYEPGHQLIRSTSCSYLYIPADRVSHNEGTQASACLETCKMPLSAECMAPQKKAIATL